MEIVIEPSRAVAVIPGHPECFRDQRVGVIPIGGSIDLDDPPWC